MPRKGSLEPQDSWRRRLYLPTYSVSDAARYARTSAQIVAYWHHRGGRLGPVLPGRERRKPLSYLQAVEVAFVATFRTLGVSLQRLRTAHQYFAQQFDSEFPFAELLLKTDGHHVLMDLLEVEPDAQLSGLIVGDAFGQMAWQPLIGERFAEFDYEHGLALRWYLDGRDSPVLIDPRLCFGAPTVNGIPTWVLKGRYQAGEPIEEIVGDFYLELSQVLASLKFEGIEVAA